MKRSLPFGLSLVALLFGSVATARDSGPDNPGLAPAASVTLAPLRIELDGEERAETLRVINPSQRAIGVQVRVFDWTQENGEDRYAPSSDVRVSPSIITIAPGDTQIFRVMRRELPSKGERRYRIAVDQLPDPALERAGQATARIRFTIPMFIDRALAAPAQLGWTIEGNSLRVANSGEQTARMVNLALADASGTAIPIEGAGLHYVMGGEWLAWTLPNGCPTGPVRVSAQVDGEAADAQVTVNCG